MCLLCETLALEPTPCIKGTGPILGHLRIETAVNVVKEQSMKFGWFARVLALMGLTLSLGACGTSNAQHNAQIAAMQARINALEAQQHAPPPAQQQVAPAPIRSTPVAAGPCRPGNNCWVRLGASPFMGSFDDAMKLITAPEEVKKMWKDQVVGQRGVPAEMPDGTVYKEQVYTSNGVHVKWTNVEQALGYKLKGVMYTAVVGDMIYDLFIPPKTSGGCDNWSPLPPRKKQ